MASKLKYTPTHTETGIALSVLVKPEDFISHKHRQHHKEHPSTRPELQDDAGRALRYSYTQQLPDQLHMGDIQGGYHSILWGPEKTPSTRQAKITKTILHICRVVPREAIVLTGDDYEIKVMDDDEHSFISHPLLTHVEGRTLRKRQYIQQRIGSAILSSAIEDYDASSMTSAVKDEYVNTLNGFRERELGNQMIREAVEEAIRPAISIYEECKREGMVDARYLGVRAVVRNFIPENDFGNYYELLRQRLDTSKIHALNTLQSGVNQLELAA